MSLAKVEQNPDDEENSRSVTSRRFKVRASKMPKLVKATGKTGKKANVREAANKLPRNENYFARTN